MSGIVGLLGIGGGAAGSQFAAPTSANIVNPTNPQQLAAANTATQNTMAGQQGLLTALQGQNGLGNQSSVYNQMQGTAGQYQNIANGTGPNPAMAQLAQTTGQNVAQTGALMAGQRGAGANVGLMARQAGQQGAATQQQAVGQGATLAAQQQLAGLSGLQAQQQNMAGVAAGQVANQVGQTNANTQAAQAQQANLMGAQANVNTANVGMQSNMNSANAQLANTQMQGQQSMVGGLLSGAATAFSLAGGGDVHDMAQGGNMGLGVDTTMPNLGMTTAAPAPIPAPQSSFGKFLKSAGTNLGGNNKPDTSVAPVSNGMGALYQGSKDLAGAGIKAVTSMSRGGSLAASGGKVLAKNAKQKATKPGDNYSNDKIPAMLSEHEIVLPREVTMSLNPVNDAARFVSAIIAKRRGNA
jgi:hypothetical protein